MFKKIWPKTNFDFWGQICLLFCQGDSLKSQNFQVVIMSYWEKLKKLLNEIFKILIFYLCLHFVVILTSVARHFGQKSPYFLQNILTHLVKWQLQTISLLQSVLGTRFVTSHADSESFCCCVTNMNEIINGAYAIRIW